MKRFFFPLLLSLFFLACEAQESRHLFLLHTNDTHSSIEADKKGKGGIINRAVLIRELREKWGDDRTLLFDCGDFSQGSLFYNLFKGEADVEFMNTMEYDAATIGNHEFDYGMENLARLARLAHFPILSANYDFSHTPCEGLIKPYVIFQRNDIRVGVFGLSPRLEGLVAKKNSTGVRYLSPIESAKSCIEALRKEECDVIVCLSHLGWQIASDCNDEDLLAATEGIDVLLGGHSHDSFEKPRLYNNEKVMVQQMGKSGKYIGYIELTFEEEK